MAYATASDIQSEFKDITFSASTAVTSTDVSEFITQEEAALEAEVATVYETPVTGTKATAIMKLMTTLMVKARILEILPVKTGKSEEDQGNPSQLLRERVTQMLDNIKAKKLVLVDATLLESSAGVSSYNTANSKEQLFERDTEQW